jgi:hypothetical protein
VKITDERFRHPLHAGAMKKDLNDERSARLLVLCARPHPGPGALSEARRLLGQGVVWGLLLPRAEEEGVLPLLYWNLRDLPEAAPPEVLERLKRGYLISLLRNSQLSKQLEPFLGEVKASGLPVVLTKGPRLALSAYPDPALRPFWDVDFVVPPRAWPEVAGILARLRFEEARAGDAVPQPSSAGFDGTYSPYFRKGDLVLEFHFNTFGLHFPGCSLQAGVWRPPRRPMPFRGTEALVFTPEAELSYLCLHAQQHSYERLIWLVDIAEMASRRDLDWDEVGAICADLKIHAPVFHGLCLAEALWPGTVPGDAVTRLRPGPLARRALRFFWPAADVVRRRTPFAWPYDMPTLFSLWERRAPGLAVRTVRDILFPPRPWLAAARKRPERSARLYVQYARRISHPFGLAARRLVRMR